MKKTNETYYSDEILIACRKGKQCDYGICDECPNTLGIYSDNKGEDDENKTN